MKAAQPPRSILVPVLNGDITEATLARGRSMRVAADARFVFLHIVRAPEAGRQGTHERSHCDDGPPLRWRQLASAAHPGRVFVEVLQGDPARIIAVEAERFHSDAILLDGCIETPARAATARAISMSTLPQEAVC